MTKDQQASPADALASSGRDRLWATVIAGGYCIGCGACAVLPSSGLQIQRDGLGRLQAVRDPAVIAPTAGPMLEICPFAESAANEDELAQTLYGDVPHRSSELGGYRMILAGHVAENGFREQGSSGGLVTWLLVDLLRRQQIDAVAHVKPTTPAQAGGRLFEYGLSWSVAQIQAGAKSRYYPIEMSGVLRQIRARPGRYAVVGVPCFIKAIRLLQRQDKVLAERITHTISLFCGHLKSAQFADFFGWQLGIAPGELQSIDFRCKLPNKPADQYGIEVTGRHHGQPVTKRERVDHLQGGDWGTGLFKYYACEFCDDVVGETADISIGDAWLPEFVEDHRGANVVVVRTSELSSLIQEGIAQGRLALGALSAAAAIRSQAAGFRHRREGLAYRLYRADQQRQWRPTKRVAPAWRHLRWHQRRRYRWRTELAVRSHLLYQEALQQAKLERFFDQLEPLLKKYRATDRSIVGRWSRCLLPRLGEFRQRLRQIFRRNHPARG